MASGSWARHDPTYSRFRPLIPFGVSTSFTPLRRLQTKEQRGEDTGFRRTRLSIRLFTVLVLPLLLTGNKDFPVVFSFIKINIFQ